MVAIRCRDVVKRYGHETALSGLDLEVQAGETVALRGPSGSGKTTLLHVIAGLVTPDDGTVEVAGEDIWQLSDAQRIRLRREKIGLIFQSGFLVEELTSLDNVALPALAAGVGRDEARDRATELLSELGVQRHGDKRPHQLSGGQRQRVAIARALVNGPTVVLADEPTGSVDRETGAAVMRLLLGTVGERGGALLLVTHDPEVAGLTRRTVEMRDGHEVPVGVPP